MPLFRDSGKSIYARVVALAATAQALMDHETWSTDTGTGTPMDFNQGEEKVVVWYDEFRHIDNLADFSRWEVAVKRWPPHTWWSKVIARKVGKYDLILRALLRKARFTHRQELATMRRTANTRGHIETIQLLMGSRKGPRGERDADVAERRAAGKAPLEKVKGISWYQAINELHTTPVRRVL